MIDRAQFEDQILRDAAAALTAEMADALTLILDCLSATPKLTALGEVAAIVELAHCVVVGTSVTACELQDDEIVAATCDAPVVIGGLPRTGTSLLHAMLATAAPAGRVLSIGEAFNPVASVMNGGVGSAERDLAEQQAAERYRSLEDVAPNFYTLHPLGPDQVEECTPLLQASLRCLQMHIMFPIGEYADWILTEGARPAYVMWRRSLEAILSDRRTTGPLLLKSPLHVTDYDSLLDVAPEARIIQIERSSDASWRSFVELVTTARSIFTLSSRDDVIDEWAGAWRVLRDRADRARENFSSDRLLSIGYSELLDDPVRAVSQIAEWADLEIDPIGLSQRLEDASRRTSTSSSPPFRQFACD